MAQDAARKLDTGVRFPPLRIPLIDGTTLQLPADAEGRYSVLLFYRGHW
ncbi:MAG: hypothetical protein ABFS14_00750 [Gemmatimonadota bacterium]